jgi:hypothetical protein
MRKNRGRHVHDRTGRDLNTDELKVPEEGMIVQYAVYGTPGGDRLVKRFRTPLSEMHPLDQLTGTISLVQMEAFGSGDLFLQVNGYSLEEAEAQWDIAAATIGAFRIKNFPAPEVPAGPPTTEQVVCANCGGHLIAQEPPDSAIFLHADDSAYCASSSGALAQPVRLGLHTRTPATGTAAIPLPDLTAVIPPLDLGENEEGQGE